jgi:hypothetical protein
MQAGLRELQLVSPSGLSAKDGTMQACVQQRFSPDAKDATVDGPAGQVLAAYRNYWKAVMLKQQTVAVAEAQLLATLNTILPAGDWDRSSLQAASDQVKLYLDKQGWHTLTGVTTPLYELMLWHKEDVQHYPVQLPETKTEVTVAFMGEFATRGWLDYETCGRYGTGGWAEQDRLYALDDAYDRNSENFKVSYLDHEGQHFSDYQRFPKLEAAELEYRAKLVELTLSRESTRKLLLTFAGSAKQGRSASHPHAEYWLMTQMSERLLGSKQIVTQEQAWSKVDDGAVRETARQLLLESSAKANAAGALQVSQLLPD